jgi:hypothetical protein
VLKNGLPSHDTFRRLFRNLDPDQFRACFQRFMAEFSIQCQGVIAIGWKVLRRSFDRASGKSASFVGLSAFQLAQKFFQIGGQRGLQLQQLAGAGVRKFELRGMKEVAS